MSLILRFGILEKSSKCLWKDRGIDNICIFYVAIFYTYFENVSSKNIKENTVCLLMFILNISMFTTLSIKSK